MEQFEPNYSVHKLQEEFSDREPVRDALEHLRVRFGIEGWTIVELGSGIGTNLSQFTHDNEVLGVEGLSEAAILANGSGIPTVVANLERRLPLVGEKFDLILCLDVLEHLFCPEFCLQEASRLLRHSGKIVVNVPNHFSLSGRINLLRGSGIDSTNFFPTVFQTWFDHCSPETSGIHDIGGLVWAIPIGAPTPKGQMQGSLESR